MILCQVSNFHAVGSSTLAKKNEQRAITPKLGKVELRFLYTALVLNDYMLSLQET